MMQREAMYKVDEKELRRLYYDEELSVPLVSKKLGVPKHFVYAEMRRLGLKRRSCSEAQKLRTDRNIHDVSTKEMVRLYFDEEKSLARVGEELGVSWLCVRHRLLKIGYKIRDSREARFLQHGGRSLIIFSEEDRERIRILYCDDLLSLANIGFRLSVSPQIIKRTLIEMGVRVRTVKEAQKLRREKEYESFSEEIIENVGTVLDALDVTESDIIKYYRDDKLKIQEVAVKCSLSTVEVYGVLQKAGHLPAV